MNNSLIIYELIEIATKNTKGYPFSAILFSRGYIFYAVNTVLSDNNPSAHAEINVIRAACSYFKTVSLSDAIIYSSGEPCPMCLSAIAWADIKKVYYLNSYRNANNIGYKYDCDSKELNNFLNLGLDIQKLES